MAGHFFVEVPETARERMRGLRGRKLLGPREGMLFERARSVHTFGMRAPIAVAFLDGDRRVIDIRVVPPARLAWNLRARHVLECAPDAAVRRGDPLTSSPVRSAARDPPP